jgi:hypothetical protein
MVANVNQVYEKVVAAAEALRQQWLARRNHPTVMR